MRKILSTEGTGLHAREPHGDTVSFCDSCARPTVDAVTWMLISAVGFFNSKLSTVSWVSSAETRTYGGNEFRFPGGVTSTFTQIPDGGAGASSVIVKSTTSCPFTLLTLFPFFVNSTRFTGILETTFTTLR